MTRNGNTTRKLAKLGLSAAALAAFCGFSPSSAYADCTSPVGVAGDMIYNSTYNLMQYCNGASWINMSSVATVAYGTLTPGDFCTAISTNQIACTTATINLSTQASGTLQAAQFPALTGDVTTTAGSLVTTIGTNKVTLTKLAQISGLSVLGNAGASTGNVTAITGTANQVLMVNSAGTSLGFGALDLANAVTGILTPAHGGTGVNNGTSTITLTGNLSTTGGYAINLTTTGATSVTLPTSGALTAGTGTANYTARWTGTNTLGTGVLYDNGTSVGIGTTTPAVALDLSGKTDALALPVGTTGTRPTGGNLINGEIRYNNTSSNIEAYINGAWTSLLSSATSGTSTPAAGSDGYVQFNASNKLAGDSNLFWDNSSKRLGIGNAAPSYPLQVTGTAAADIFLAGSGSAAAPSLTPGGTVGLFSPSAGVLGFSTGASERIRITSDGKVGIGTTSPGASLTVVGSAALPFGTDYSTIGTQSSVSLLSNVSVRYTGAGNSTFNGIAAGTDGQIITLHNASNYTLTLANQSTSESTAANRIITGTGGNFPMTANSSAILQYDGTAARWRVIGGSASGTPAGTTGQVQFNSGSNTFAANANFTWTDAISQLVIGTGAATATGTAGTVSSVVMNIIPQAVSPTYGGGTIGGVSLGSATTGQVAYYSGATSLSGSTLLSLSSSNVGIGTAASGTDILAISSDTSLTNISPRNFYSGTNSGAGVVARFARGTAAAPTYALSGDRMGWFSVSDALNPAGFSGMQVYATENHSASAQGMDLRLYTSPNGAALMAERMRIDPSGNIGIGTTSNYTRLNVAPSASTTYGTGATYAAKFMSYSNNAKGVNIGYDDTLDVGVISVEYAGNPWRNLIIPAGNVGIGTTGPAAPLDVNGGMISRITDGVWAYQVVRSGTNLGGLHGNNGILSLNSTTGVPIALLGGDVGIGSTAPAYTLDVAGWIRSTSGIVFPDGTTQTTKATSGFSSCTTVSGYGSVSCPGGYTMTGGGCTSSNPASASIPSGNGWSCTSYGGYSITAVARCCK